MKSGYVAISFGEGEWIGHKRIARLYAFLMNEGYASTYQYPEIRKNDKIIQLEPFWEEYLPKSFLNYAIQFRVHMKETYCLERLSKDEEKMPVNIDNFSFKKKSN